MADRQLEATVAASAFQKQWFADLRRRLIDALAVLLVRLHLAGFFWGDCSLSNTLFRRDAGLLQAYIIDVETSERYTSYGERASIGPSQSGQSASPTLA